MAEQKEIRILAAIMFTDMVGYTKMMQENEAQAKKLRKRHRAILEKHTGDHMGKTLEFYGDGSLSIFGSAVEAVQCAIKLQKDYQSDEVVPVRIGIHMGDIIYEDDGVIGDGINISSRIQSIGVSGSVLISDKIFIELKNHKELKANYLGHFDLKNVQDTVGIYSVVDESIYVPESHELEIKGHYAQNSIAVLPFVNMSSDPENEFFSDGLTEEILNVLAKIEGLKVTSRTSSFAYKNKNNDIKKIGEQLGVSHILEGSVRKSGSNVRITAQLINVLRDYHLWSDTYDHVVENVFKVQDEISNNIADVLVEKFDLHTDQMDTTKKDIDYEAYQNYLKGNFHWNKWTPDNTRKALEFYQKAVDIEPKYAEAHAGIANCYNMLGTMGQENSAIVYPKADASAKLALELNPDISAPHTAIMTNDILFHWNWEGAKYHIEEALRIDGQSSDILYSYGFFLLTMRRRKKAIKMMKKSVFLDPLSANKLNFLGFCYMQNRDYEKAIDVFDSILEMDPDFRAARDNKARCLERLGQYEEALELFLKNKSYHTSKYKGISSLVVIYERLGDMEKSDFYLELMKEHYELEKDKIALEMDFVFVYVMLNRYKKALKFLKLAMKKRIGSVIFLMNDPHFDEFKDLKDVKKITSEIGLDTFIESEYSA